MRIDRLNINHEQIKKIIIQSNIKQYHLAKKIGVSEKTISRWIKGDVASMSALNAEKLSEVLNCKLDTFIHMDDKGSKNYIYEQLFNDDLLSVLSPLGKWETLITLLENLPRENISNVYKAMLYNWLSIGYWRTHLYDIGLNYAYDSRALVEKTKHPIIFYQACMNIGTIQGLQGKTQDSLKTFLNCYENIDEIESTHLKAMLLNNLSMTYFDLEQYDMALKYQEHTIHLFESMNKAYNLAIAYTVKGFCLIELSRFNEGLADFKKALNYSGLSHYANGLVEIPLYMTYGKVRNHLKVSLECFKRQVKAYDALDHKDPYGYYLITYIFKHLGDEKSYNFWYKTARTHISDNLYVIRKIESI